MTFPDRVQRLAEYLIRRACRHLPDDTRDERYQEWTAELPAILTDPDVRWQAARAARALRYAADHTRGTRHPRAASSPRTADKPGAVGAAASTSALLRVIILEICTAPPLGAAYLSVTHHLYNWIFYPSIGISVLLVLVITRLIVMAGLSWLQRSRMKLP